MLRRPLSIDSSTLLDLRSRCQTDCITTTSEHQPPAHGMSMELSFIHTTTSSASSHPILSMQRCSTACA
jgi:hypothetical protein